MMYYKTVNLNVFLEATESIEIPNPVELANELTDGLPKEWLNADEGYSVRFVPTISNDAIGELTLTIKQRDHKIEKLNALLAQEQKLTAHLDAEVGRMELQTNNLIEKNDNQVVIIKNFEAQALVLSDALVERTEALDVSQHDLEYQRTIADERGDKMLAWSNQDSAQNVKIRELKASLLDANQEAQNHAVMVAKIVDAMEGTGYDISGWGNDADLTELEQINHDANDALARLDSKLDYIRTER